MVEKNLPFEEPQPMSYDEWVQKWAKNQDVSGGPKSIRIAVAGERKLMTAFSAICNRIETPHTSLTDGVRMAISFLPFVTDVVYNPINEKQRIIGYTILGQATDHVTVEETSTQDLLEEKDGELVRAPNVSLLAVNIGPVVAQALETYRETYDLSLDQSVTDALTLHNHFFSKS